MISSSFGWNLYPTSGSILLSQKRKKQLDTMRCRGDLLSQPLSYGE
uniref:NAC domain-containing protein 69-like isoform X1 n=1 Tax=Rhizophora mucronata TaxID=61149 RepID=A0A2P2KR78_RHIMU